MNFIKGATLGAGLHINESRGMKECEDGEEDRRIGNGRRRNLGKLANSKCISDRLGSDSRKSKL